MKKRDLLLLVLSLALLVFGAVQLSLHFANRRAGLEKEDELRRIWRAEDATEIPTFAPVTPTRWYQGASFPVAECPHGETTPGYGGLNFGSSGTNRCAVT